MIGIVCSGGMSTPQAISTYASAAGLPAGVTEGTVAYTKDTDTYYYYDGAAWHILVDDSDHAALTGVVAGLAAHIAAPDPHPQYALDIDLAAHVASTSGAHVASGVTFTPGGTVAATDVQAAIAEVASEADTRLTALEGGSTPVTIGAFGSTPNVNGLTINGTQVINAEPADATNPGSVSIAAQSFAGQKNLMDGLNVGSAAALGASEIQKITSTSKGAINAPVMTTAQKNAIGTPTVGMRVYDSDLKQPCYYNGSVWENEVGFSTPAGTTVVDGANYTPGNYRRQIQQIAGTSAATALDILTTNAIAGDQLILVGTDSTNTLTIVSATNTVVNGSCTLGLDDTLSLIFINSKWREQSRSA